MRKFLSVCSYFFIGIFREYRESFLAYMDSTVNLGLFLVHKVVSEYAEKIYAYIEKTPREMHKTVYMLVNNI
jgi:hypothetical protein